MSLVAGLGSARVELGWVERALATLRDPDLRPAWKEARKPLRADQRDHARKQSGPDGAWAGRSPLTTKRRGTGTKKRARRLLGRLPSALTAKVTRKSMKLVSLAKWSKVHQDGGTAGQGARIPARPFLWASEAVLGTISQIVSKGLKAAFDKVR